MRDVELWEESAALFRAADSARPAKERFTHWKDSQEAAFGQFQSLPNKRIFLFFPTGEGKSKTSLALIKSQGFDKIVVVAPKKTHSQWERDAAVLDFQLKLYSPEKFRMKGTPVPTNVPWIIDEYHKLGGPSAQGFKKWKSLSAKIQAPIVGMSATPNYNDPDRVFCLEVTFEESPVSNYGDWLYKNCKTEPNRFAYYPIVTGLLRFDSPLDMLKSKSWVAFVEDTAVWNKHELVLPTMYDYKFEQYGLLERQLRVVASDMEKRHARVSLCFLNDKGRIRKRVLRAVQEELAKYPQYKKWLIVCAHKTIATALYESLKRDVWLITGDTKDIEPEKNGFIVAKHGWLIGTTALAEGVDGLDKTCQAMLLLDDIEGDASKRRQIIGRILPRGTGDERKRLVITAKFNQQGDQDSFDTMLKEGYL